MVSQTYVIRTIEPEDRAKNERWIEHAQKRGDIEEAAAVRDSFAQWEREQGQHRERLVCSICGSPWLSPTAGGTARVHRRHDDAAPSWDKVRRLQKEIKAMQAELDRLLDALEP
jgi:putative intracellular protease/amidase